MKIRIVTLLLTLCMLMGLLISCGGAGNEATVGGETTVSAGTSAADGTASDTAVSDTTVSDTTLAPTEGLVIVPAGGKSDYTILRAENADSLLTEITMDLHSCFLDAYGKDAIKIGSDWVKRTELDENGQVTNNAFEILIGQTNRVESAQALAMLEADKDYIIAVIGNKLVITGRRSLSTKAGVQAFIEQFVGKSADGLILERDLVVQGKGEALAVDLTEGADFRIMTFNVAGTSGNGEALPLHPTKGTF